MLYLDRIHDLQKREVAANCLKTLAELGYFGFMAECKQEEFGNALSDDDLEAVRQVRDIRAIVQFLGNMAMESALLSDDNHNDSVNP